ncbi:MAG: hypothetical protein K8R86_03145, partial [Bacteroidales bacterium]|nr:hypothetical protein [Bacteroidales bacterium]
NFLGLIGETDVYNLEDPDLSLVDQNVPYKNFFVREHQHIFEVIKKMSSEKITVLPVLNEKDQYLGCITANILTEHFAEFISIDNPGAIIILELNQKDFVLSQIAQIIESQDAKILTLYITPEKESTKMELTLKISKMEIQPIIQALNRYNYIIKATFTEDEGMYEDLRDRYDSLMNYLNI